MAGTLDPMWIACLGGFEPSELREPGQPVATRLEGCPVDQAALQGVLDTLFMLGMRLIRVECLPPAAGSAGAGHECEPADAHQAE